MSAFEFAFPAAFCAPTEPSLVPLFRLLDEWDREQTQQQQQQQAQAQQSKPQSQQARRPQECPALQQHKPQTKSQPAKRTPITRVQRFTPRFDIRETEDAYEFYGELPGIERENINVEFTEPQTLVISGKVERKAFPSQQQTTTETPEETPRPRSPYQATVEDDAEDEEFDRVSSVSGHSRTASVSSTKEKEVAKVETPQQQEPEGRFLLQERGIGEFARTFHLPARVETEGVSASLENGILSLRVPKAKYTSRVVYIN